MLFVLPLLILLPLGCHSCSAADCAADASHDATACASIAAGSPAACVIDARGPAAAHTSAVARVATATHDALLLELPLLQLLPRLKLQLQVLQLFVIQWLVRAPFVRANCVAGI